MHILASMCTRLRYDSTLASALMALGNQTRRPDAILVIDDTPPEVRIPDVKTHPVIGPVVFAVGSRVPIHWIYGPGTGPHNCHEFARTFEHSKELVWRVDDDEVPEPDVLAGLEKAFKDDPTLGAAAGLVLTPGAVYNPHASSRIEDLFSLNNAQWHWWKDGEEPEADHLHSSYLYRRDASSFPRDLSPVGHTEETFHTYRMKLNGYKLRILPSLVTWHLRQDKGGIRSQRGDYAADRSRFMAFFERTGRKLRRRFPIVANQGIGDCFALYQAIPDILRANREKVDEFHIFVKPELIEQFQTFASDTVCVHPVNELALFPFQQEWNVYVPWGVHGWKTNLVGAYRRMYGVAE